MSERAKAELVVELRSLDRYDRLDGTSLLFCGGGADQFLTPAPVLSARFVVLALQARRIWAAPTAHPKAAFSYGPCSKMEQGSSI